MAPFKLRFSKSGSSRSASTEEKFEQDAPSDYMQDQLTNAQAEMRTLLPGSNNDNRLDLVLDYSDPIIMPPESCIIPSSPPPSYEYVLNETRLASLNEKADMEDLNEDDKSNLYVTLNDEDELPEKTESSEKTNIDEEEAEEEACAEQPKRPVRQPEEIFHKSSKELYRAVAKQWGITCKVSDHCRCLDCQSHYFDCDYDQNENEKTDGGLSAGTPMLIHEVMHGSGCVIL